MKVLLALCSRPYPLSAPGKSRLAGTRKRSAVQARGFLEVE